jgi:hypothetical protein
VTWINGVKVAGAPAKYNQVGILKIGPAKARNVLLHSQGGWMISSPSRKRRSVELPATASAVNAG